MKEHFSADGFNITDGAGGIHSTNPTRHYNFEHFQKCSIYDFWPNIFDI